MTALMLFQGFVIIVCMLFACWAIDKYGPKQQPFRGALYGLVIVGGILLLLMVARIL